MIFDLFRIIIISFSFLVISIFSVKYIKSCTLEEATKICVNFIKNIIHEIISDIPPTPSYPIWGMINGCISSQYIENSFRELYNYFEVIYFDCCNNTSPNWIIYRFKISNPKTDIDYINFISLLQKVVEKILATYFRNYGLYIPVENFVAVKIDVDTLYVSIATTDIGIAETENIRRRIKADYFASQRKEDKNEIMTDWNDSEH